ncbi:MAG: CerR family C-terminal domain-containing protein [Deltaproteobacteria bacterium]|nr:CerR family C-terminal domain-containing protein [Deltaproteobacteria bacterium]
MNPRRRKDSLKTRKKLLNAAIKVFSKKGFRDATVIEICTLAGANVAAVNYHFGSKEALYREAWRYAFLESLKKHPAPNEDESLPPDELLKAHIRSIVYRVSDPENREISILFKEISNPTGLLDEVIEEELTPLKENTEKLLKRLLGPYVPETEVKFSAISIVSQCMNPLLFQRAKKTDELNDIQDVDAYVEHVFLFSLLGIQGIRAKYENREP